MSDDTPTMDVSVEPDSQSDLNDGMYVTYEYLGQLIRRANHTSDTHCVGCRCTE
jgi:hypothetical protein